MRTIDSPVRLAEPDDADALVAIHTASWRMAYAGILPYRALGTMLARRGRDWWTRSLGRGAAVLLVEFDGRPVGYATLGRNRTAGIPAKGEIYELYLLPEYQGAGLGRRLFAAGRGFLAERGLGGLAVWALAENDHALAFYRTLGGAPVADGYESFDGVPVRKIAFYWA